MTTLRAFVKVLIPAALIATLPFCGGGGGGGGGGSLDSPNVLGGYVYFPADDGGGKGAELWRSNGIDAPILAADINSGAGSSYPLYITRLNGKLYFCATTPDTDWELFVYDPAFSAAGLAADINTNGNEGSEPEYLTELGGRLYFRASKPATLSELFVYNPALSAASLAADIWSGAVSSNPEYLTELGGRLYFSAESYDTGYELFVYDPALSAASLAADINTNGNGSSDSFPRFLTELGGRLYFSAWTPATGYELFVYDPALSAVSLAADINTSIGPGDSNPRYLTELDGKLYFSASTPATGTGRELFVYDPALSAVSLAADINTNGTDGSNPEYLTVLDGRLYFSAYTPATGFELFVYDPALSAASLAADINSGAGESYPRPVDRGLERFTVMGSRLFFTADNGSDGYELYTLLPGSAPVQAGNMNPVGNFVFTPP